MEGSGAVSYTVKELLDRIDRKVDNIDTKLDLKADRDRVHDVSNRLATLELARAASEPLYEQFRLAQREIEELQTWRNRLLGATALAVFLGASALARVLFG